MHCVFLFEHLSRRIGKHRAGVTLARKLLVAVWLVLTQRELAHGVDEHQVASWLMPWAWRLVDTATLLPTSPQPLRRRRLVSKISFLFSFERLDKATNR
jgi:hypothetical protein